MSPGRRPLALALALVLVFAVAELLSSHSLVVKYRSQRRSWRRRPQMTGREAEGPKVKERQGGRFEVVSQKMFYPKFTLQEPILARSNHQEGSTPPPLPRIYFRDVKHERSH